MIVKVQLQNVALHEYTSIPSTYNLFCQVGMVLQCICGNKEDHLFEAVQLGKVQTGVTMAACMKKAIIAVMIELREGINSLIMYQFLAIVLFLCIIWLT